ncbi:MAG: geranylgeranylglyceryl/heptaprenylglyceryl phosphate synthase [Halobaculum sp.]
MWPRTLHAVVEGCRVLSQQLFGDATNPIPASWSHVTKIDPEPEKRLPLLFPVYLDHSSAVSVGGSRGVTPFHTEATFDLLELADTPAFHEPSAAEHVTAATRDAATFLALPEVLNGDVEALVGTLGEGIESIHDDLLPARLAGTVPSWILDRWGDRLQDVLSSWLLSTAVFEAYIIQNPDSAAAREASVTEDDLLSPSEARRRAMAAEHHLDSEVVYLEYSGTFGGDEATEILTELADVTEWARVWYGGGVRSSEQADAVLAAGADAVVVGDVFHDIAAEEATLARRCAEAVADGDASPAPTAIREWVRESRATDDLAATQYLSTIPTVDSPAELAHRYLTATISLWLWLADGPADAPAPWETEPFADLFADDGESLARCYRAALDDPTTDREEAAAVSLSITDDAASLAVTDEP